MATAAFFIEGHEKRPISAYPPDAFIGIVDIADTLCLAHAPAKRLTQSEGFPPSIRVPGARWPQWRAGSVARWLDETLGEL